MELFTGSWGRMFGLGWVSFLVFWAGPAFFGGGSWDFCIYCKRRYSDDWLFEMNRFCFIDTGRI